MTGLLLTRRHLLLSGGAAVLAASLPARAHNGTVHVTIENMEFRPAEVTAHGGETIEWVNRDRFPHTATVKGKWEVLIPPGTSASRQVQAGDSVNYYCRFHPNMKGRIVVATS